MRRNFCLLLLLAMFVAVVPVHAGNPQRIGHTTFIPRHSSPDDDGLYNAFIDQTNGYAYFLGSYLFKVDISGDSPQVVSSLYTGGSSYVAIDAQAGYGYIVRPPLLNRYLLGAGTNPVIGAGSLALNAGTSPGAIAIDDSDPDPARHNAYVFCRVSGSPTRVAKVALGGFTNLDYITLNAGETNGGSCLVDAEKGYIYFATTAGGDTNSRIIKIQMKPGTNNAERIGSVNLGSTGEGIGFGSLDSVNGYAYYGTYGSSNSPSRIYKVKLGEGNTAPALVGHIDLNQGEAQLSLSVIDPVNGFVYFANDNTYPGGVHQFSLNGTNLPVEIGYVAFQSGPSNNLPDRVSTLNVTINADGVLPYGEVYFRSAVFDPVRGYAYFGQDSRPDQIVKFQVAKVDPFSLNAGRDGNGAFELDFTNIHGGAFTVSTATNLTSFGANWTTLGSATEIANGQFQFIDLQSSNNPLRFYQVRGP
jgi:hypothetical protein